MASLDRSVPCRWQFEGNQLTREGPDGDVSLSITVEGQLLSVRMQPVQAIRMGTVLLDLGLSLDPAPRGEGH